MGLTNIFYLPEKINNKLPLNNDGKIYTFSNYDGVVEYYKNGGNEKKAKGLGLNGYILQNNGINTFYDLEGNEQCTFNVINNIENNLSNNQTQNITGITTVISSNVIDIRVGTKLTITLYPISEYSPTQIIGVVPSTS